MIKDIIPVFNLVSETWHQQIYLRIHVYKKRVVEKRMMKMSMIKKNHVFFYFILCLQEFVFIFSNFSVKLKTKSQSTLHESLVAWFIYMNMNLTFINIECSQKCNFCTFVETSDTLLRHLPTRDLCFKAEFACFRMNWL